MTVDINEQYRLLNELNEVLENTSDVVRLVMRKNVIGYIDWSAVAEELTDTLDEFLASMEEEEDDEEPDCEVVFEDDLA